MVLRIYSEHQDIQKKRCKLSSKTGEREGEMGHDQKSKEVYDIMVTAMEILRMRKKYRCGIKKAAIE